MKPLLVFCLFAFGLHGMSQSVDCETNIVGLDDYYEGDCKKGLAHGKGTATGDLGKYTGDFKKGFPDGVGKLIYIDGTTYQGEWKRGEREGQGDMTYPNDSTISGYWKEDRYIGLYEHAWEIIQKRGNARYKVSKMSEGMNKVEIKFFRGGQENPSALSGVFLSATTGVQYNTPGYMGFEQIDYPVEITLNFTVPNQFNTSNHQEYARFKINEPGGWLIRVNY